MTARTPATQNWVLVGTAAASEAVWGLRRIEFPCGYNVPAGAIVAPGGRLEHPNPGGEAWAMGGFALEVGRGGKGIAAADADEHVAGYRPWICVFHDALLDELRARNHSIEVWDRGVSLFYGLWREATHSLGELISCDEFEKVRRAAVCLETEAGSADGSPAEEYAYDGRAILPFMSDFMTLSSGDIYVLGPLVATRVTSKPQQIVFKAGDVQHTGDVG